MLSKAQRTKKFILETAAPIFNEKGFAGTNIDDVLIATKLTKGAIYSHFINRDDLAIQSTMYGLDAICARISQLIDKEELAKDKIFAYLNFNKDPLNTFIRGGCPIFNTAVESDDNQLEIKQQVSKILFRTHEMFTGILEHGIASNEFSKELDAAGFAFKMFAAIEGGVVMCRNMGVAKPMHLLVKNLKKELETFML